MTNDLSVECLSEALKGRSIDVVVSGSIGAVEAVRFIRALRRLSANVQPWLTAGGAQFVTPLALSWAAANETRTIFSGTISHIAQGDACVVAPASANMLRKIAQGLVDTPASALITSYLGQRKPVIVVPNMHESLSDAPNIMQHVEKLQDWGILVEPRREEGKLKFPAPEELADEVSHVLNKKEERVVITAGGTRSYIDDVRYVGNYSTGALGTALARESYRWGFRVDYLTAAAEVQPSIRVNRRTCLTNDDLAAALKDACRQTPSAIFFAAAVLDFVTLNRESGKISSKQDRLHLELRRYEKIIANYKSLDCFKVAFKLEPTTEKSAAIKIGEDYLQRYNLDALVVNGLNQVSLTEHRAFIVSGSLDKTLDAIECHGKLSLANTLIEVFRRRLSKNRN